MSEKGELLRRIGSIEANITNLQENYKNLQVNYQVLNDSHVVLETDMKVLRGQISLACTFIMWIISPSMVVVLLLQLASAVGMIK